MPGKLVLLVSMVLSLGVLVPSSVTAQETQATLGTVSFGVSHGRILYAPEAINISDVVATTVKFQHR